MRIRPRRALPVTFGVLLLGLTAIAGLSLGVGWTGRVVGPGDERIVAAGLPRDVPARGMVYDGLIPGGPGSICADAFVVEAQMCTHGPDPVPAGSDVRRAVAPTTPPAYAETPPLPEPARVTPDAEVVRDQGTRTLTAGAPALVPEAAPGDADFVLGPHGVACEGDGQTGRRVQALYAYERGVQGRFPAYVGSIRAWTAGVDRIVDASAGDTGGSRHVRFVTTPDCAVDVTEVQVPAGALGSFTRSIDALRALGYNRTDRKYLIFADATIYCGIGTYVGDSRPGLGNRNNGGPSYGRVDAGCWGSAAAARELGQMLGALRPDTRPYACTGGLDCGHDDFFRVNPRPGSPLATGWNAAGNEFLLRGDGGDDIPDADGSSASATTAGQSNAGTLAAGVAAATVPRSAGGTAPAAPGIADAAGSGDSIDLAGTSGSPGTGSTVSNHAGSGDDGDDQGGGGQGAAAPIPDAVTDLAPDGVAGSVVAGAGVARSAVSGSGAKRSGATGSGVTAFSAIGSGANSARVTGSAVTGSGVTGSGVTGLGITGFGLSGSAVSGSGLTGPGAAGSGHGGSGKVNGHSGSKPGGATGNGDSPGDKSAAAGNPDQVQAAIEVRDPTSTALRLMWSTAGPGTTYRVSVDGRPVGTTVATRARLIGLRPDTTYTITVENAAARYRARSTGRTAPAARPAPGSWFVLTNALTGGAADLYAARADDGTPITLGDADGGTPEQWRLVPATGGGYTLRSRATGRCMLPLDGVESAGEPLVQGDCAAPGVPHWTLEPSDHGCTLRTAGGLVVGVGGQRFGGDRVLTLQTPAAARQQSWTAIPG